MPNEYFEWLCEKISDPSEGGEHWNLVMLLFQTDFYAIVPNDDNRIADGEELRMRWANSRQGDPMDIRGCTMLEMMIALAERMEYFLMDTNADVGAPCLFWNMVQNLGLWGFTDTSWSRASKRQAEALILRFLSRDYDWDGTGGLFPLGEDARTDQRTEEIWKQMQQYLILHFSIA